MKTWALGVALALLPAAAGASITLVRVIDAKNHDTASSNTSLTMPIPAGRDVTAGNSVIVSFEMYSPSGTPSCADSQGNVYTLDEAANNTTSWTSYTAIFSAHGVRALTHDPTNVNSDSITVSWPAASTRGQALIALEFSGLAPKNALDRVAAGTGGDKYPASGLTPKTSQDPELAVAAIGHYNSDPTFSAGSGYTYTAATMHVQNTIYNGAQRGLDVEYQLPATAAQVSGTGTFVYPRYWSAVVATYESLISAYYYGNAGNYSDGAHWCQTTATGGPARRRGRSDRQPIRASISTLTRCRWTTRRLRSTRTPPWRWTSPPAACCTRPPSPSPIRCTRSAR